MQIAVEPDNDGITRYDSWEGDEYLLISFKDDIVVSYELEYGSNL